MAIEEEEDFSFLATAADSPPCFIESPPLWRPLSAAPQHEKLERPDEKEERKESYNYFAASQKTSRNRRMIFLPGMKMGRMEQEQEDDYIDEEEKMDMLWEDLNEEFSRNRGKIVADSDMSSADRDVQISCVKTLKLSKSNSHLISGKKLSFLLLMKILMRKVFDVHNSHSSTKKQAW